MSQVDSDLKHHQETWHGFIKGAVWLSAICALTLLLLAAFVV
jgi:hypothetical protein